MNILITGVGGQGAVLASKILAQCAVNRGERVRTAETIGMAQRGGSVTSHVRVGDGAFSPLIPRGQAELLIGFEPGETARNLPYLAREGAIVFSDRGIQPSAGKPYDAAAVVEFLERRPRARRLRAQSVADAAGGYRPLNVALLGKAARAGFLPFSLTELETAMRALMSAANAARNLPALYIDE
jgi:indolepyruvate ferredoxin oxidoreductase beta subunit